MRDICRSDRSARETLLSSLSIDCPCQKILCFASGLPMPSRDCLLFRNQMPITMGHLVAVRLVVSSPSPRSFFLLGLVLLTYRKRYRSWQPTSIARLGPGLLLPLPLLLLSLSLEPAWVIYLVCVNSWNYCTQNRSNQIHFGSVLSSCWRLLHNLTHFGIWYSLKTRFIEHGNPGRDLQTEMTWRRLKEFN